MALDVEFLVAQLLRRHLALLRVARGEHDVDAPLLRQLAANLEPDAAVAAGHDRDSLVTHLKPFSHREHRQEQETILNRQARQELPWEKLTLPFTRPRGGAKRRSRQSGATVC